MPFGILPLWCFPKSRGFSLLGRFKRCQLSKKQRKMWKCSPEVYIPEVEHFAPEIFHYPKGKEFFPHPFSGLNSLLVLGSVSQLALVKQWCLEGCSFSFWDGTLPPIIMEVKNGCISNRIVTFQKKNILHWTMIMGERVAFQGQCGTFAVRTWKSFPRHLDRYPIPLFDFEGLETSGFFDHFFPQSVVWNIP